MSVDVRCTACKAKLRLDEAPEPGVEIECPKCGISFIPLSIEKKKEPKEQAKPEKKPKVSKPADSLPRTYMPSMLLFAIVGGIMFFIFLLFGIIQWRLNSAGAVVQDTIEMIMPDSSGSGTIYGVNIKQMRQIPGYKNEMEVVYSEPKRNEFAALMKAAGKDADSVLDYYIQGSRTDFYVMNKPVETNFAINKSDELLSAFGASKASTVPIPDSTATALQLQIPGSPNVYIHVPKSKLLVVSRDMNQLSYLTRYRLEPRANRLPAKLGQAGQLAVRGHIWIISYRKKNSNTSPSSNSDEPKGQEGGSELVPVFKALDASPIIARWIIFGGNGVRLAGAIEVADKKAGEELVKTVKSGQLGKGDEYEPSSQAKSRVPFMSQKKSFQEFMQYVEFKSVGNCAYFRTRVSHQNSKEILPAFNLEKNNSGGPGMPGGPGGPMPGGPGGPMPGGPGGPMPGGPGGPGPR